MVVANIFVLQNEAGAASPPLIHEQTTLNLTRLRSLSYVELDEQLSQSAFKQVHSGFVYASVSVESLVSGNIAQDAPQHQQCCSVTKEGSSLFSRVIFKSSVVLGIWFFCSFMTIFMNKYILSTLDGDPGILGEPHHL